MHPCELTTRKDIHEATPTFSKSSSQYRKPKPSESSDGISAREVITVHGSRALD